jgi:hypothetical protein
MKPNEEGPGRMGNKATSPSQDLQEDQELENFFSFMAFSTSITW